ncbi:hypothetical protein FAI40_08495 [Acetobacteraceae bacterium]|nr:hypothetical protein FAI40_08495 [Acetobacteraceae bacterium]
MSEFMTLEEAEHYLDLAKMVRYTKEARALADKGKLALESRGAPEGWHVASDDELASLGLKRGRDLEFPVNNKTGKVTHYFSQIFVNDEEPQRVVLAHPGTNPFNLEDLLQNTKNIQGKDPFYYSHSRDVGRLISKFTSKNTPEMRVEVTGQSLGGGQSADISKDTGIPAITFAAMGPNEANVQNPKESLVRNFFIKNDFAQILPQRYGTPSVYSEQVELPQTEEEKQGDKNVAFILENFGNDWLAVPLQIKLSVGAHGIDRIVSGMENGIAETKIVREQIANSGAKVSERLEASDGLGLPPVCDGDIHLCPIPFHFETPIKVTGKSIFMVGRLAAFTGCVAGCGAVVEGMGHLKINGLRTVRLGDKSNHGGVCMTNGSTNHIRIAIAKDL